MTENYPHPVNISRENINKLRTWDKENNKTNGDGYNYKYDPNAESVTNANESFKMDALRLKQSPTATDLANKARR